MTCSSMKSLIPEPVEVAHILVLHGGEFLQFILSVVNVNFEHVVGLLLDFFFPLVPVQT